jgi:hypothetical protein
MSTGSIQRPHSLDADSRRNASDQEHLVCQFANEPFILNDLDSRWPSIARSLRILVRFCVTRHLWTLKQWYLMKENLMEGDGDKVHTYTRSNCSIELFTVSMIWHTRGAVYALHPLNSVALGEERDRSQRCH